MLAADRARGGQGGVELDVLDESLGLNLRVAERLALFARQQRGDLVEVLARQRRAFHQDLRTLGGQHVRPGAKGCVRGVDRLPGLLDARLGNVIDQFSRRRVTDLYGFSRPCGCRLAVNHHRAHLVPFLRLCARANWTSGYTKEGSMEQSSASAMIV